MWHAGRQKLTSDVIKTDSEISRGREIAAELECWPRLADLVLASPNGWRNHGTRGQGHLVLLTGKRV